MSRIFFVLVLLCGMSFNLQAKDAPIGAELAINEQVELPVDLLVVEPLIDQGLSEQCDTMDLASTCCKICRKGKACGNSCISKDKTCHKGKGCACDG